VWCCLPDFEWVDSPKNFWSVLGLVITPFLGFLGRFFEAVSDVNLWDLLDLRVLLERRVVEVLA
jgi:hypothetical protein